ncbi:MAG: hypothetical protein CMI64_01090, partial [Pedosphaera sp.]|nr:hypothetical protein [Pedosphaera sp.]
NSKRKTSRRVRLYRSKEIHRCQQPIEPHDGSIKEGWSQLCPLLPQPLKYFFEVERSAGPEAPPIAPAAR